MPLRKLSATVGYRAIWENLFTGSRFEIDMTRDEYNPALRPKGVTLRHVISDVHIEALDKEEPGGEWRLHHAEEYVIFDDNGTPLETLPRDTYVELDVVSGARFEGCDAAGNLWVCKKEGQLIELDPLGKLTLTPGPATHAVIAGEAIKK